MQLTFSFLLLHPSSSPVCQAKFADCNFDMDCLVQVEQRVLAATCCNISPLCTPSSFLHRMMELTGTGGVDRRETVLKNADLLIAEFWGGGLIGMRGSSRTLCLCD